MATVVSAKSKRGTASTEVVVAFARNFWSYTHAGRDRWAAGGEIAADGGRHEPGTRPRDKSGRTGSQRFDGVSRLLLGDESALSDSAERQGMDRQVRPLDHDRCDCVDAAGSS